MPLIFNIRNHFKTELSQIVTSKLIFRNSETLQWKNENKKAELSNSRILLDQKFRSYLTRVFYLFIFILRLQLHNSEVLFSLNASPKPYRPSKTFFWTKLGSTNKNTIICKISRILSSNMDFSLAHFTNFNFAHFLKLKKVLG